MDYSFLRSRAVAQAAQAGAAALAVAAVPTHYRGLQVIRVILAGDSECESSWGVDFGRSGSYLLDEVAADFQHPPPPTGPPGTLAHTPVALANSGWPNKRRGTRTNRLWPHLASRSSDGRIPAFRVVRAQFVDVDGAF